ncbi:MAG TPA: type I restriction endonuclease subunit R [Methanocorpusculum sp.]|nr:type I restriction endonuclease subunit R [Methanocorpusculum sp.]
MTGYKIIAESEETTVVAEYEPTYKARTSYQSEADLEKAFIQCLGGQGYDRFAITREGDLIKNLRVQLEKLNSFTFTDNEWERFFTEVIANNNENTPQAKSRIIQEDSIQVLKRDDGTSKNITLIDRKNIHNNFLQIINQYEEEKGNFKNRYDVSILVNGLPLVHVELKRRGVAIKEAFNQINRYQRDSFWAGSGLYNYVQIFVISNGTHTKYYSNTTRYSAIKEHTSGKKSAQKTSSSFEFTSYWADNTNKVIPDLMDFAKTFFARHTLLNILTKYCVFTSDQLLLVMRPYQIAASEHIINRVRCAANHPKYLGTNDAGGYIWHTTGSGKTLTSFKTAQVVSRLPEIDKVLFVVDRKDLDYQTMKEYERFEKGAADGNRSTAVLTRQLQDRDAKGNPHEYKIIVTTIQKLDSFIKHNQKHEIYNKHVVLIFDECHRSQFGKMHTKITGHFKKYHLFGFTGTPIFAANAKKGGDPNLRTTQQAFGTKLHTYTIVDAINDGNVLPFKIDFINTIKNKDGRKDKKVEAIDTEEARQDPRRIANIVEYILENFDRKTKRNSGYYSFNSLTNITEVAKKPTAAEEKTATKLNGFNSIFAVSGIPYVKIFYTEFKKQMAAHPEHALKIATIYSYNANAADPDECGFIDDENSDDTNGLNQDDRMFLESAIDDYNKIFGTAYDTSAEKFPNYYKDVSLRMKNREIDLLLVVDMFLTGFDATTLNTLWVDKNLRQHGLIQAFSRTNRILNSIKTYGNIVTFRNLEAEIDAAIGLFGDKDASGIVLLKSFKDYYEGGYNDKNGKYQPGYKDRIEELLTMFPLEGPASILTVILGEKREKDFIVLFGNILRLRNILLSFDEFKGMEILTEFQLQDYTSVYHDLYQKYRRKGDKDNITDDIVFEMELIKQIEVNIDYILILVAQYHDSNCENKDILIAIDKAIRSSLELRSKQELIQKFISTINSETQVQRDWRLFVKQEETADLEKLIEEENLHAEDTKKYIVNAFRDGHIKTTGTDLDKLMPPISRFGGGSRSAKKQIVIDKLTGFFEKYFGLGTPEFGET